MKDMWRLVLVLALILAAMPAQAQPNDAELTTQSLDAIFRLGSEEPPAYAGELATVDELTRRSRPEVLAMARARLGNAAFVGEFRDAFLVRVLRALRPTELDTLLRNAYPRLDPGGRYEVLVYGVDERVAALTPLYEDLLNNQGPDTLERESLLAAQFATELPEANFLAPLEALAQTLADNPPDGVQLGGYGRSIFGWGSEPENLVMTAVRRVRAAELHRQMTDEERAILRDLRGAILAPPRLPVFIPDLPLKAALSELQRVYGLDNDPKLLRSVGDDILARRVSIDALDASAAEAFAAFCNQTGLSTLHGYHASAGSIGAPALTRNHTTALEGLVLKAEPRAWATGDVSIGISVSSPARWYPIWRVAFYVIDARLYGGRRIPHPADYSARLGIVPTPIDEREWNELGRRIDVLEGELAIPIPTTIRRVRITPQTGRTIHEIVDDIFFVEVTTSTEKGDGFEVEVRYGTDLVEVADDVTTLNLGTVELFDEHGRSLEDFAWSSGHDLNFRTRGYRRAPRPAELVWTLAPLAEILRVRARWEDIHIMNGEGK